MKSRMTNSSRALVAIATAALSTACAAHGPATAPTPLPEMGTGIVGPAGASAAIMSRDVHWARNSAEHRAVYLEVYRAAGERLATLMSGHSRGTWGVILDADETTLDNSEYQRSRSPSGGTFDAASWSAWVNQGRAPALPGAVEFVSLVHQLGGKVAIVTNRDEAQCPVTRANLTAVGITADVVLCKAMASDKNPRFESVQRGTAESGLPPLVVLEWIGDNIEDFPLLAQNIRSGSDTAFAKFGDTYFVLPNAMYGSWEKNPRQ